MSPSAGDGVGVEATFAVHAPDESRAYAAAAALIDRINAAANLPQCECDVRISVERLVQRPAEAR